MTTPHRLHRSFRRAAYASALALACSLPLAQGAARADTPGELVLSVQARRLSQAELKKSLDDELAASGTPEVAGTLTLTDEASDVVRIRYRDAAGNVTVRDLRVPPGDPELLGKVSVAAANLLRSQDELVAELRALAPSQGAPSVAPGAPPASPPAEPGEPPAPAQSAQSDFKPRPGLVRLMTPLGTDPCRLEPVLPLGADVAPWVGTSSVPAGRSSARHVSLSLFGSYSLGTRGVTLSAGANIDRRGTCGAALGLANVALGPLRGVQYGVANFAHGGVRGAQLGTFNTATGGVIGAQLGTVSVSIGRVLGIQTGTLALTLGSVRGIQAGVASLALGAVEGAQVGVGTFALGELRGVQAGLANVTTGSVEGAQLGLANYSGGNATVQLGLVNYAHHDNVLQLGLVNVARDTKASIGLIDVVRRGRTSVDAWATENGTLYVGATHGSRVVHNLYGVGGRTGSAGGRFAFTYGLGARVLSRERVTLDFDVLSEMLIKEIPIKQAPTVLRARLALSVYVTERIAVLGAVGYALGLMRSEERTQAPFGQTHVWKQTENDNPLRVEAWPSFTLGARVALGSRTR